MTIRIPDDVVAGPWAAGVNLRDRPDVLELNFLVVEPDAASDGDYVAVSRVYLSADAILPFYVELGAVLQRRTETHREP